MPHSFSKEAKMGTVGVGSLDAACPKEWYKLLKRPLEESRSVCNNAVGLRNITISQYHNITISH
jgi:hypothetical protein